MSSCHCQTDRLDELFAGLCLVDMIVAKAAGLSEIARLAKIEARLREYLLAKWEKRAAEAAARAGTMAEQGKSASAIASAIDRIMAQWSGDVEAVVRKELAETYELARVAAWKKATGETTAPLVFDTPNFTDQVAKAARRRIARVLPSFDANDAAAISSIQKEQMFWIGEHYGKDVSQTIRKVSREAQLEAGRDRRAAGKLMRRRVREELGKVKTPAGFHGSSIQYFEGLAANATTVARNYGHVRTFRDLGVSTYEINNPRDSRTCPVCGHMDGKRFTVEHGWEQMFSELVATKPDDIRKIHPWKPLGEIQKVSPKPGHQSAKDSASLADAGFALPPYHFRCRCTIDVTFEAGRTIPEGLTGDRAELAKSFPELAHVAGKLPEEYFKYSPTTPYDPEVFKKALLRKRYMSPVQRDIRQQTQAMLQEQGIVIHHNKHGRFNAFVKKKLAATTNGTHAWDGTITINSDRIPSIKAALENGVLEGKTKYTGYLRTVIHEEIHHASPISSWVYTGQGVVLEEATTEMAARRVLGVVTSQEITTGSYTNYIDHMKAGLSKTLGITDAEAATVLTDASINMRKYRGTMDDITGIKEYFEHFIKQVPAYEKGAPVQLGLAARKTFDEKLYKSLWDEATEAYLEGPYK